MPRFVFRLQAALDHRTRLAEQAQRELAGLTSRRAALQNRIQQMQQMVQQSKQTLSEHLRGKVDLSQVGQFARYSQQVELEAQQILPELAELEKQIEAARRKLLEAAQARQALELLRDKQLAQWRRQQERLETAATDELANQAYARRLLEGSEGFGGPDV